MIDKLLEQLRKQLEQSENLPDSTREELLKHVSAIESRTATTGDVAAPSGEATAEEPQGLEKLRTSVEELEVSHPELTALVNRVAVALGNMGI